MILSCCCSIHSTSISKMQILAIFCGLAALASAYPGNPSKDYVLTEHESLMELRNSPFGQKYLMDTRITKTATLSDFRIYFYTRKNRNQPVVIINNDVESVMNSGLFNSSARIISITHGFQNDHTSEINTELTEAILDTHDVNVFVSDWGTVAHKNYLTAEFAITEIGQFLGDFINKLVSRSDASHKQITLIGHSLGAHIAGEAGSHSDEKIDLIIGLDPAAPLISSEYWLEITDADFVHVIHSSRLGISKPIGHADYYPNGGNVMQPGCLFDMFGTCSHGRSFKFLADSIKNSQQKYWAFRCENFNQFKRKKCFNNDMSFLGTIEPDRSASGKYFLKTNKAEPYAYNFNPSKDESN